MTVQKGIAGNTRFSVTASTQNEAAAGPTDRSNPKDSKAMQSLAMLYFKKGDFDNGVLWLKKRLEVEGNNPEVYYLIGVQAWDRSYNFPDLDPVLRAKIVEEEKRIYLRRLPGSTCRTLRIETPKKRQSRPS